MITLVTVLLISMPSLTILMAQPIRQAKAEDNNIPGFIDEVDTYFEITDSVYLNITLTSTETVHVVLQSIPRLISCFIESSNSAASTVLTFRGFEPETTYYRYQDIDLIETFTSDSSGAYTYEQDLSQSHHIRISEETSTLYIHGDYTFTSDIEETIMVWGNNFVIDGNGYTLQGAGAPWSYGFYFLGGSNITIKNVIIRDWMVGIYLIQAVNCKIKENTILNNGQIVWPGWPGWGILSLISSNTEIYHNDFVDNSVQAWDVNPMIENWWHHNYWSDYGGQDLDGDFVGDTGIPHLGLDWYPLMIPSMWKWGPSDFIQLSIDTISSWNLANNGFALSLTSKLGDAIHLYNQGNVNGAIHKLQDLITKVTNDSRNLTPEQKNYLILNTQMIINRMQG